MEIKSANSLDRLRAKQILVVQKEEMILLLLMLKKTLLTSLLLGLAYPLIKLLNLNQKSSCTWRTHLHQRIIGQEDAVKAVSRAIRRARVGLKNPNRPHC